MNRMLIQRYRSAIFLALVLTLSVSVFAQINEPNISKDLSALQANRTVYIEGTESSKLRAIPMIQKRTNLNVVTDRSKADFVIKVGYDYTQQYDNPSELRTKMPRLVESTQPVPLLTTNESRMITNLQTSLLVIYHPNGAEPKTVWSKSKSSRIIDVPMYGPVLSRPFDLDPLPAKYYSKFDKDLERLIDDLAKELKK